jgi:hypothetical protein
MTNHLSKEEVNKLFKFVESKYVQYLDVQYEIVDHLASAIEEKQSKNSELSFEKALNKLYSEFPITGFAAFVSTKQSAMSVFW